MLQLNMKLSQWSHGSQISSCLTISPREHSGHRQGLSWSLDACGNLEMHSSPGRWSVHRAALPHSRVPPAIPCRVPNCRPCWAVVEGQPETDSERAAGSAGPCHPHTESPATESHHYSFWSTKKWVRRRNDLRSCCQSSNPNSEIFTGDMWHFGPPRGRY